MLFGKTKLELKVGAFVFAGLVILTVFVLSIGSFKTWASGYNVHFLFNFVNGVKLGAPVRFSGVDVGVVKKINFIPNEQGGLTVQVISWVKSGIKIPIDSEVWVNTLGLLGEKYIEVMPGKDTAKFLAKNESLVGKDPMATQEMGEMLKRIATNIEDTFTKINSGEGTIGKFFSDASIYDNLDAFVADIKRNPWKLFYKTKEK